MGIDPNCDPCVNWEGADGTEPKATKHVMVMVGSTRITRAYGEGDPIFRLPAEKAARKVIADAQRDLMIEADRLVAVPITVRG